MSKSTQVAKIRVGYCTFRIEKVKQNDADLFPVFILYRCWKEYTGCRVAEHKQIDGKYEFYHDALKTVANYQEHYFYNCRLPELLK